MSVKTEANGGGGGRKRGQKTGVGDTNGTNGSDVAKAFAESNLYSKHMQK